MTDTRRDQDFQDPRNSSGHVNVRPYTRQDGTDVKEHSRSRPVARGKLRFQMTDQDIRLKGKISTFDQDGRKTDTQRINVREKLTPEESRKIRQLQEES